jgi:hypothetical protein
MSLMMGSGIGNQESGIRDQASRTEAGGREQEAEHRALCRLPTAVSPDSWFLVPGFTVVERLDGKIVRPAHGERAGRRCGAE